MVYRTPASYTPTPTDIAMACKRIQSEWTPRERDNRKVYKPKNYVELEPLTLTTGRRNTAGRSD